MSYRQLRRIAAWLILASLPCLLLFAVAMNVYKQAQQWGWIFALQPFFFTGGLLLTAIIAAFAYAWAATQLRK